MSKQISQIIKPVTEMVFGKDDAAERAAQAAEEANRLQAQATAQAEKTAKAQAEQSKAMQNLQANQQTDLATANVAQVVPGGTAKGAAKKRIGRASCRERV